jgi:hypothetical protein
MDPIMYSACTLACLQKLLPFTTNRFAMTKRQPDEPDNKAAERLKQFREARGLSDDCPEEETQPPEKNTRKASKTRKKDEGT